MSDGISEMMDKWIEENARVSADSNHNYTYATVQVPVKFSINGVEYHVDVQIDVNVSSQHITEVVGYY